MNKKVKHLINLIEKLNEKELRKLNKLTEKPSIGVREAAEQLSNHFYSFDDTSSLSDADIDKEVDLINNLIVELEREGTDEAFKAVDLLYDFQEELYSGSRYTPASSKVISLLDILEKSNWKEELAKFNFDKEEEYNNTYWKEEPTVNFESVNFEEEIYEFVDEIEETMGKDFEVTVYDIGKEQYYSGSDITTVTAKIDIKDKTTGKKLFKIKADYAEDQLPKSYFIEEMITGTNDSIDEVNEEEVLNFINIYLSGI